MMLVVAHARLLRDGSRLFVERCPFRVICDRVGAHRKPLNVRFAPKATKLLRRREMARWTNSKLMRCSKRESLIRFTLSHPSKCCQCWAAARVSALTSTGLAELAC